MATVSPDTVRALLDGATVAVDGCTTVWIVPIFGDPLEDVPYVVQATSESSRHDPPPKYYGVAARLYYKAGLRFVDTHDAIFLVSTDNACIKASPSQVRAVPLSVCVRLDRKTVEFEMDGAVHSIECAELHAEVVKHRTLATTAELAGLKSTASWIARVAAQAGRDCTVAAATHELGRMHAATLQRFYSFLMRSLLGSTPNTKSKAWRLSYPD